MRTWLPDTAGAEAESRPPVVVLGHGGGRSKDAEEIEAVAGAFVRRGCAVLACDWPGHGKYAESPDAPPEEVLRASAELICDPEVWTMASKEWEVALELFSEDHGLGRVGYWGLSLGTVMGVGVAARVHPEAAVLGLAGIVPSLGANMRDSAAALTCPVRFLHQTDDELFPLDSVASLLEAFAAEEVEVRRNPGGHFAVPMQEIVTSVAWLAGRLHGAPALR